MNPWERSVKKINKKFRNTTREILALSPRSSRMMANNRLLPTTLKPRELFKSEPVLPVKDDDEIMDDKDPETAPIGLDHLLIQARRRFVRTPFSFTLMVVGRSGLGKSTLINSMFLTDIYGEQYPGPTDRAGMTVQIESTTVMLAGRDNSVRLTVVDTPGFGDQLDNSHRRWESIVRFVERGHREYFQKELSSVNESFRRSQDGRVHCCLYFITPTGHRLTAIDLEFMRHLQRHVALVPIIAKADSLTPDELTRFKSNIRKDLTDNQIEIFQFPYSPEEFPLAIVGSNYVIQDNDGRRFRGRKYPWGVVNIQNPKHCDFERLRDLLIRKSMYDLVEYTDRYFYEKFRNRQLKIIFP